MDVYRIGTLLEGIRELVAALTQDGKRVKVGALSSDPHPPSRGLTERPPPLPPPQVCVQGSMGQGVFTAMPLQLSVRREQRGGSGALLLNMPHLVSGALTPTPPPRAEPRRE